MTNVETQDHSEEYEALIRDIMSQFMDWTQSTFKANGVAITFTATVDGSAVGIIIGGQPHTSPAYDRSIMRLTYELETSRGTLTTAEREYVKMGDTSGYN